MRQLRRVGANDATMMRAPCLLLPSGDEQQMERPIARIVNTMSTVPQRLAKNIALETPRGFGCRLHRFPEECDTEQANAQNADKRRPGDAGRPAYRPGRSASASPPMLPPTRNPRP